MLFVENSYFYPTKDKDLDHTMQARSLQSAGVTPEVNMRITQAKKHQQSKRRVLVTPRKELMSSKKLLKKGSLEILLLMILLPQMIMS